MKQSYGLSIIYVDDSLIIAMMQVFLDLRCLRIS